MSVQRIFTLRIDVEPNRFFPIPARRLRSEIPIFVLSNAQGAIQGVLVGEPQGTSLRFEMKDGKLKEDRIAPVIASREVLARGAHRMQISAPVVGKRELFFVDGTGIHPERGGKLRIRYVSSPLLATVHAVEFEVKRLRERWVASVEEGTGSWFGSGETRTRYVQGARIGSSLTGVGFSEPLFEYFEPTQPLESMIPRALADARMASRLMKLGEKALDAARKQPYSIGYGIVFQFNSQ